MRQAAFGRGLSIPPEAFVKVLDGRPSKITCAILARFAQDGAKQFCERSEEACTDAVAAAAQTAADLEDVKAYHDLVEENLGLVPAVAVDTAAVRDASRVLVGTDNAALTDLMGAL